MTGKGVTIIEPQGTSPGPWREEGGEEQERKGSIGRNEWVVEKDSP